MVGGGVAGCLHVDHLTADSASTFEHGNLVRGVCVLGMLSQTFVASLGVHAHHVYLQNSKLDAATANAAGLVQELRVGVHATQMRAQAVARLASNNVLPLAMSCRASIDLAVSTREAVGHAECQFTNDGFANYRVAMQTSAAERSPCLRTVVDCCSSESRVVAMPLRRHK